MERCDLLQLKRIGDGEGGLEILEGREKIAGTLKEGTYYHETLDRILLKLVLVDAWWMGAGRCRSNSSLADVRDNAPSGLGDLDGTLPHLSLAMAQPSPSYNEAHDDASIPRVARRSSRLGKAAAARAPSGANHEPNLAFAPEDTKKAQGRALWMASICDAR